MHDNDIKPEPPERPLPGDCCGSGCDRCVEDIYAEEFAFYETRLAKWRTRQAEGDAAPPQTAQ